MEAGAALGSVLHLLVARRRDRRLGGHPRPVPMQDPSNPASRGRRSSRSLCATSERAAGEGGEGSLGLNARRERDDDRVNHRPREDVMRSTALVVTAGRRRSPATLPGYHQGRPPRNKVLRYPADPPTVEEIVAVMRVAGDDADGVRLRGLMIVLWRAGLRISEALALAESDLDSSRGALLVRHGKGDKRREVGIDRWAWEQSAAIARRPRRSARWRTVLRAARPDPRMAVRGSRRPRAAAKCGDRSAGAPTLCAASTPARARRRDVARGRAASRHSAPTRACRSRDHLRVSARDRQHRDRPRRP
jgi:integrase